MSEAGSDSKKETMGVVVGDQQEGETEDVVLIPDQEGDHEIKKSFKVSGFVGLSAIVTGIIIIGITGLVWPLVSIPWFNTAAPILWLIIGIFITTHGVIAYCKPPQMYSLEVIVNGKQFSRNLPLKQVLLSTTNVIFGLVGILTMSTVGPCCWWPVWNIIGLTLSIIILVVALISSLKSFSKAGGIMNIPRFNLSDTKLAKSTETAAELLTIQLKIFSKLLPLPSIETLSNLDQVMKQPRKMTNKPAHVLCILLGMIVCVVMFTAQIWDVATMNCTSEQGCYSFDDPDDAFARDWVFGAQVSDRKIAILVSTPITFLLCTMLLLLMKGSTVLRMLLSCIICLVIGIFFFGFSLHSVQIIIMMGVKFSSLAELLMLVSLLPIPLLSSLFLALAYSNIVQVKEEKEATSFNNTKICLLSISIILAIIFSLTALAAMTSSDLVIMSSMQAHWNTTHSHSWDEECQDPYRSNYNDYGYQRWNHELTTTTTAPRAKPDKCYGKQLDHGVQDVFVFFSVSQVCLTEFVLFLSLFVFLTGRRITKKSLFFPGIFLFAAAISTIIAFFSGVVHYDYSYGTDSEGNVSGNDSPFLPFLFLNGISTFSALGIGLICIVIGGALFISIMTVFSRIILSIIVFVCLVFFTLLQAFLKLSSYVSKNMKEHKVQPEVTLA